MRKMKKAAALIMTAVLVLCLWACGGQTGGQESSGPGSQSGNTGTASVPGKEPVSPAEGVYKDTPISAKLFGEDTSFALEALFQSGGRIYSQGIYYDMEGNMGSLLANFLPDGTDFRTVDLPAADNAGYTIVGIGEDGAYYLLESVYSMDEAGLYQEDGFTEESPEGSGDDQGDVFGGAVGGISEEIIDEEPSEAEMDPYTTDGYIVTKMTVSLIKLDADGREVWRTPLEKPASIPDEDYYGASGAAYIEGSGIFICNGDGIRKYDPETGKDTGPVEGAQDIAECSMIGVRDSRIFVVSYSGEGTRYQVIDTEKNSLSDPLEISDSLQLDGYSLTKGTSADLLLTNDSGIYTWNIGDPDEALLCSFINSDMDVSYVDAVIETGEGELLVMLSDSTGSGALHYLTPVDASQILNKTSITVGSYYMDSQVRSEIVRFNRENEKYRIVIRDYSVYNTDDGESSQGLEQLNADILNGNVPDMLLVSGEVDAAGYVEKGVFADLSDWFEKDASVDRNDLLANVMDAVNPFDGTYFVAPSFSLTGMALKAAYAGEDNSITIEELNQLAAEKGVRPEYIFGADIRDMILYYAMQLNGADFIDLKKGTCSFDSASFISMLEFASLFPNEYPEDSFDTDFSDYYLSDKALLYQQYVPTFADYNYLAKGTFGCPIAFMGFPADKASGPAIQPDYLLAMSASSPNQEGVWAFIRDLLSEDYQKGLSYSFPVLESALEAQAEAAIIPQTYVDEEGNLVEDEMRMYIGDQEVVITTMTKEEADSLLAVIRAADHCVYYNENVMGIVEEEASAFFSGEKTAAEAAAIIQSRVEIYISENS